MKTEVRVWGYNVTVAIRGKLISEISQADIFDLINQRVPEDAFLDFKKEILDPRKPKEELEKDKDDWVADLMAFANAQGGHIIIGVEADEQERAFRMNPMLGDQAKRLADRLRDLAIEYVKPHITQLEIADFKITDEEWIVIARVPDSQEKPHMSDFNGRTRFTVRAGNRKREMAYDEIQSLFVNRPQEQRLVRVLSEIQSVNSRLDEIERIVRKAE